MSADGTISSAMGAAGSQHGSELDQGKLRAQGKALCRAPSALPWELQGMRSSQHPSPWRPVLLEVPSHRVRCPTVTR